MNKQKVKYLKRFIGSRIFRTCMIGMMVVCLVMVLMPNSISGEERRVTALEADDDSQDGAETAEDTSEADGEDVLLEEIEEDEDLIEIEEDGEAEESKDAQEESDGAEEKSDSRKEDKKSDTDKSVQKPKAKSSSQNRKLDNIPRTGPSNSKAAAGLVGTIALGLYLYSRKLRMF